MDRWAVLLCNESGGIEMSDMESKVSGVKKYRKKPVVIEAVRFEKPFSAVKEFCPPLKLIHESVGNAIAFGTIQTLEGEMRADIGDWIIKGVQGEFYPCKPDIFEATYEEATNE